MSSASLAQRLTKDATSGFLVFLIALPLCLGISMASGFPPVAGVLTAIVGGVLTSHIGSAPLTIKGPAAGLIVIALGAVTELGMGDPMLGYKRALAVGVVAAVIQIIFALVRADRLATIMPPSVVHGMLAAIGVIIIAKQTPVVLGVQGAKGEPLEMLMEIPHTIAHANPAILVIGAVSLAILVITPKIPVVKKVPAPLLVLLFAVPAGMALGVSEGAEGAIGGFAYAVDSSYLVRLPGSLLDAVAFPDFSAITSATSIKYIVMFALIGSVESLLSALAVDAIDPEKRASNLRKDLLVTGIGNLIAASIGGLPMISEIVRSRANIDAGARSAWSNWFHGLFLLGFVALLPGLLQLIPLAALAAMLVITGTRLASPGEFKHAFEIGWDQLLLFVTTAVVTLATDLLVGVGVGIALKLVLHLVRGRDILGMVRNPVKVTRDGALLLVQVTGPLAFTNLMGLEGQLRLNLTEEIEVVEVDVRRSRFVDHTTLARLEGMANEWPKAKLKFTGMDELRPVANHPTAFRKHV
jgi:MFS superfamily sulfate permease-like transporter